MRKRSHFVTSTNPIRTLIKRNRLVINKVDDSTTEITVPHLKIDKTVVYRIFKSMGIKNHKFAYRKFIDNKLTFVYNHE